MGHFPTSNGGVSSFNTRTGAVTLDNADVAAAGGVVYVTGADPTGVVDATSAFNAALASLPLVAGVPSGDILFPAGTFMINGPTTPYGSQVYVEGAGENATLIMSGVSGGVSGTLADTFRQFNPTYPTLGFPSITAWAGGIANLTIDGTNAANYSCGYHYGDAEGISYNGLRVQNFRGTGSIGLHEDNTVWWTEKTRGQATLYGNTSAIVFDVSGATTSGISHFYSKYDLTIFALPGQDGVVFANGSQISGSRGLKVTANMQVLTTGVNTAALIRFKGTTPAGHPGAGSQPSALNNAWDIKAETDGTAGASTLYPYTIYFDTPASQTLTGTGGMWFTGTGWQNSNANVGGGGFKFAGTVVGDTALNPANSSTPVIIGGLVQSLGSFNGATGVIRFNGGDYLAATLSASITIAPNGVTAGSQRKIIVITQAAAGGPYTVTWPKPGSPTIGAPAFYWPGGTPPVMSIAPGAVDLYEVYSTDGIHWYGIAHQAMS